MKTVKHLLAFLMIILLSVFLCSCSQSAKAQAEKAIKKDLDLLKNLDSETTMQYISYQELFPDSDDSTKLSADIKEVFSLFFQNFDYKILGISVDSDEKNASAQLKLTTLDAEALASDFVSASLQEEILETASGKENDNGNSLEQRYLLLYKLLKNSILNTSDSAKNAIASALMEQFHSCFNYKISSTSVSGYLAEVDAELTTFDSNSILTQYEKELNTYLASADAVIDGSQKRYNKSHELLLDSIRNNQATITATATFHLTNDGASWKLENAGTELGNAIFGTLTASPVPEDSTEDNE